ncbi:aldehyde ferredoxin oxidoreductase family protein [Bacteroidota bacterium]
MKGMFNKILHVDLNKSLAKRIDIDKNISEEYIGGRGLGVKLFTDKIDPNIDPLGPENILVLTTGPITGTSVPTNGRMSLVTKSPLTKSIFYSNTGGFFGFNLKRCACDGIIIEGSAKSPKYIVVDGEEGLYIKDATSLWGLDTEEGLAEIKKIEGEKSQVLMIGPAGENMVKISSIMNNSERAFGRGGVGAVWGSKNLKAIVVKNGKRKTEIDNPELLKKYVKSALDKIKVVPVTRAAYPLFGTSSLVNVINDLGMFPIRNFQKGYSPEAHKVSGESIRKEILQETEACFACSIRCGRKTKAGNMEGKGPEYETVWALGPDCGVFDLIKITQANYYCNKLGIDTISAGGTIACAMELQEKGLLKDKDIKFGNADVLIPLVKKIAYKEGIGAELSEGSRHLSKKYKSEESSIQVKGLELPAYDPRGAMGHALGYATSNRGGCHLTGYMAAMEILSAPKKIPRFTTAGKADLLVLKQNQSAVEDSMVSCKFAGFAIGFDFYARFLTCITGIDMNITRLLETGEKIYNLERLFNIKAGLGREDDKLPKRFIESALKEGLSKGHTVPLSEMLDTYYFARNWDENGVPKPELLKKLKIK